MHPLYVYALSVLPSIIRSRSEGPEILLSINCGKRIVRIIDEKRNLDEARYKSKGRRGYHSHSPSSQPHSPAADSLTELTSNLDRTANTFMVRRFGIRGLMRSVHADLRYKCMSFYLYGTPFVIRLSHWASKHHRARKIMHCPSPKTGYEVLVERQNVKVGYVFGL